MKDVNAVPDEILPQKSTSQTTQTSKHPYTVAALYQFRELKNPAELQQQLQELGQRLQLCGTLIVATEGINGTVAGSESAIRELHDFLIAAGFQNMEYKESHAENKPFRRYKVKLKKEIVTLGVEVKPREQVGTYLDPQEWNELLADPDVVLIDTRNTYEVKVGTFQNAINPKIRTFRAFPDWLEEHRENLEGKRIAMFCTGGIRCEKSTSLLLDRGFEDVYHLKGGILKYLEDTAPEQSLWEGECFVFDDRVTLGHGLNESDTSMCFACSMPLHPEEREHQHYEAGVSCQYCYEQTSDKQKSAFRERQKQYEAGLIN